VRWPTWFAANGLAAPAPRGPRFDRSFLSLSAAMDGLEVALESTLLAVPPGAWCAHCRASARMWSIRPLARLPARGALRAVHAALPGVAVEGDAARHQWTWQVRRCSSPPRKRLM
jgi:hypothetical protein